MEGLLLRTEPVRVIECERRFSPEWPGDLHISAFVSGYARLRCEPGAAPSQRDAKGAAAFCNFYSNHKWKVLILGGKQRQERQAPN